MPNVASSASYTGDSRNITYDTKFSKMIASATESSYKPHKTPPPYVATTSKQSNSIYVSPRDQSSMGINTTVEQNYATLKEKVDYSKVTVSTVVTHGKFGYGKVVKIDKTNKYITVVFSIGEKAFVMSDSFDNGFLKLK